MSEKRIRADYRQTIALDEIAWKQIHEMADDIASSVSGTLRILSREAYARKQNGERNSPI
jgi:hypothetical protein